MAYNRKPIEIPYYVSEVENSEFKHIYNYFAADLNKCIEQSEFTDEGDLKCPYTYYEISQKVHESFSKNIDSDYYFKTETNVKPMISSFIYRELNITGVTFAPLVEANIDYLSTNLELPLVVAHEIAHTKGVMREDDANQLAFYICLNSDNYYIRFSAYISYLYQIRQLARDELMTKEEQESLHKYDNKYAKCVNSLIKYWKDHDLLERIGDWFNDLYIKSNGVDEGTKSYEGGTHSSIEPGTGKLHPSKYQQLFFEKYYRLKE